MEVTTQAKQHGSRKAGQRGSIKKRGGRFLVSLYIGADQAGKRQYRYQTVQTRPEAVKLLTAWLAGKDQGILPSAPQSLTLEAFLNGWLDRCATRVRSRVLSDYRSMVQRHIVPRLGSLPLVKVTPFAVHSFVVDLLASYQGTRFSGKRTVKMVHGILSAALEEARLDGLIARNPAEGTKDVPAAAHGKAKAFGAEQIQSVLAAIEKDSTLHAVMLLAVTTGMRYSEFGGLAWDDVDLDGKAWPDADGLSGPKVRVRRSLQRDGSFELPKTEKSARVVVISPAVVAALRSHKAAQSAAILSREIKNRSGFVFPSDADGDRALTYMQWYSRYKAALVRAGVPHVKPHALRATMATHALRAEPLHVVQQRGGWSRPDVLLNHYADVMPEQKQGAADRLEAALLGEKG